MGWRDICNGAAAFGYALAAGLALLLAVQCLTGAQTCAIERPAQCPDSFQPATTGDSHG